MHTTEVQLVDSHDDKLFRKFILRKGQEDFSYEDSREVVQSRESYRKLVSARKANLGKISQKGPSWLNAYQSPKKQNSSSLLNISQPSTAGASTFARRESVTAGAGRSIIYGDKMNKGQVRKNHPLTLFVESSYQE